MADIQEACWDGYEQIGMKEKNGKQVPNCVPVDEGMADTLKALVKRGTVKQTEKKPNFKSMSPEERREYVGSKVERDHPHLPLDMVARIGTGKGKQRAKYALSTPMKEDDEINEYCPRCMMEVLQGQHPEQLGEAEYQGRTVQLGKPSAGDVKKFKVYVKDPTTGNVKKVNFGDKAMRIKKSNPARRKSFRARHRCENPGPRTKARYWSCKKW